MFWTNSHLSTPHGHLKPFADGSARINGGLSTPHGHLKLPNPLEKYQQAMFFLPLMGI
jgi:hypothetical protein